MYVSAGVLALDRMPYADFAYLQAPYLPYLYALLFGPSAGSFALLKARLLSVVATGVAAACVYVVTCRATRSPSIALLGTIWFATHHLTLFALPLARNLGVAMAFSLAGLALLVGGLRGRGRALLALAGGVLSGTAAGFKLTFAPTVLALGLATLVARSRQSCAGRLLRGTLPYVLGATLALLPAVAVALRVGHERFF